jgi:hypothetical protein
MTTSAEIRAKLIETLQLDLVGPGRGHYLEAERLWESEPPSRWYLTGFLVPTAAPESQKHDPESEEVLDAVVGSEDGTGDDDVEPDKAPARKVFLPSSIGISVLKRFSMARNEKGFLSDANRVNGGRYDQTVLAGLA